MFTSRLELDGSPGPTPSVGECGGDSRRSGMQTAGFVESCLVRYAQGSCGGTPAGRKGTARAGDVSPACPSWIQREESSRAALFAARKAAVVVSPRARDREPRDQRKAPPACPSWIQSEKSSRAALFAARKAAVAAPPCVARPGTARLAETSPARPSRIEMEESSRAALYAARKAAVAAPPYVARPGNCEACGNVARTSEPDRDGGVVESCLVRYAQGSCGGAPVRRETRKWEACGNVARIASGASWRSRRELPCSLRPRRLRWCRAGVIRDRNCVAGRRQAAPAGASCRSRRNWREQRTELSWKRGLQRCYLTRTLKLTWPSVAALLRVHAA